MTTQVMIPVGAVPESFQGPYSGTVLPSATDGSITIDTRDIAVAMNAGFLPAFTRVRNYQTAHAPAAASSSTIVSSVTMVNGSLTIAAQPDQSRQLQFVVSTGTVSITAGTLVVGPYTANDGSTQTDNISLAAVGSAAATFTTTKGVLKIQGAQLLGLLPASGINQTIIGGTNAVISVPIGAHSQDVTILKEELDGADQSGTNAGTLTNAGLYTPHTAPNGTHLYGLDYTTLSVN
jgi:hypothetical protein